MAVQQGDWANPERSPEVRSILRDRLQQRIRDFNREHPNPPPKNNALSDLSKTLSDQINKAINDAVREKTAPTRDDIEAAARAGHRLTFNGDSTCFADLTWQDGIVDAVFQNGYAYSAPLDLETFIDWMSDDSAGKYFNDVLGQEFFAATKHKGSKS